MKALKLLLIIGIVALFVLAGCSSSADKSYYPSSAPSSIGGGCGVGAPVENAGVTESVAGSTFAITA